jgi:hypothetical protein
MTKFIVLIITLLATSSAYSCSCMMEQGSLEDKVLNAYQSASAVLLAKAETVENIKPWVAEVWSEEKGHHKQTRYELQRTQFVALESWKGEHGKRFFTEVEIICCVCGYHFKEGREYLLYLYGPDERGYYSASSCSRTTQMSEKASEEIQILRSSGLTNQSTSRLRRRTAESVASPPAAGY